MNDTPRLQNAAPAPRKPFWRYKANRQPVVRDDVMWFSSSPDH